MNKYLVLGIFALLLARPAIAVCSVPQPRLVCAEYFSSTVVVEATLVKVKTVGDEDAYVYSLHADRVIRGDIAGIFRVYEGNDSGRASFGWKTGQKYLLFLFYEGSVKSWELDGCGNSGPLSRAKTVLEQIDAIHTHHDGGVIHGAISTQGLAFSISEVRIEARAKNGLYVAKTNAKGEFEIKVPAGRYALHALKTGLSFETADFSYENPRALHVEPGGCVQVELVASNTTPIPRDEEIGQRDLNGRLVARTDLAWRPVSGGSLPRCAQAAAELSE